MGLSQKIEAVVQPAVEATGLELYACELTMGKKQQLLRVLVDSPRGVTLGECAAVSRQLSTALDVADLLAGQYRLEVSSPGLDRPLITLEHYKKVLGKKAKLRTRVAHNQQRNFIGTIAKVEEELIVIETEDATLELDLADIEKANLLVDI